MKKFLVGILVAAISPTIFALSVSSSGARQAQQTQTTRPHARDDGDDSADTPLPLVIWHGMGDSFDNAAIGSLGSLADSIHPGTYTYVVRLGDDASQDRRATLMGNVSAQVDMVCDALAADPILSTAPAIDAIGFSQGGLFLRAYVERCNVPRVRSLITFGAPHNGLEELKLCGPTDLVCKGAMAIFRRNAWSDWVQSNLVPAQYYRPAGEMPEYLEKSGFLADFNNERPLKNTAYATNMADLDNLVMVMFTEDNTIVPKESAWFEEVDSAGASVPLRERKLYSEDWLGLRDLDMKGGLHFRQVEGEHMRFTEAYIGSLMAEFFGPLGNTHKPGGFIPAYLTKDL